VLCLLGKSNGPDEQERIMLAKTMIALGFIGTMAAANATLSLAQGFEGPGFGDWCRSAGLP
jgi:hypothetical protein